MPPVDTTTTKTTVVSTPVATTPTAAATTAATTAAKIPPSTDKQAIGSAYGRMLDARIAVDQETPGSNKWYVLNDAYIKAKQEYELLYNGGA